MGNESRSNRAGTVLSVAVAVLVATAVAAENIDPADNGSQWAWGENVGWINGEPDGDGGPGMHIGDFTVEGWLWGENVGWISLTCANLDLCDTVEYAVHNDGTGALGGDAWGENVGWIRFATPTSGVWVDPTTGELNGEAWGENIGWISFRSTGPNPYVMRSGWTCDPPPPRPIDPPVVRLEKGAPGTFLSWDPVPDAAGYDVVWGYVDALRGTAGDFFHATEGCLAENETGTLAIDPGIPPVGDGYWYLVRAVNCGGAGSYDAPGASQVGLRDEEVGDSTRDCLVP